MTVFVADDHPLLLKGLVDELKDHNYDVVGMADNGASALEKIMQLNPCVALLDLEMPLLNGLEVIQKCTNSKLDTKFVILTSHKERFFIHKAKALNISGYILKDEPFIEVHKCIQSVCKGIPYFSLAFSEVVNNEILPQQKKIKLLSPSELTIVRFVAQGKSSKEIAEMLCLSARTVEKHRTNIIAKLDLPKETNSLFNWASENKEHLTDI